MKKLGVVAKVTGVVVTAAAVPIVVGAGVGAPAQAACQTWWKHYAVDLVHSAEFRASADCNGLWALQTYTNTDRVRGRYYVSGEWKKSEAYGWQWVTSAAGGGEKIIGNTVTNRRLKGQSWTYNQAARSKY